LFAACYQRFYGDVVRYARRRVGPEMAGDVAAEVFVVAWRRVDDLMSADNQLAWLYGVARLTVANTMRSDRRRSALQKRAAGEARLEEALDPSDRAETLAALRRLAPKDQEVLQLVAWEGLKGEDLAVALGISEVAARSRLHRARQRFGRALGAELALTIEGERHA
jgi:RNA polymerase sigma-70 factor, ECF subfamily